MPAKLVYKPSDIPSMPAVVEKIVAQTPVFDLHTHLYAPDFGDLLLYGIDDLLTYHYLVAEVMRVSDMPYDRFWAMPKREQADFIWDELFLKRVPFSESCRGVLTTLNKLGLDTASRRLEDYRAFFAEQEPSAYIDKVYACANLRAAVMTNDPFDDAERAAWERGYDGDPRFHAALRIDPLLNDWEKTCPRLKSWGYDVEPALGDKTLAEIRRFLSDWLARMHALYMAVSLPPDFAFPEDSMRARIIEHAVLPAAREHGIPFALMIGVTRQVNPALKLAGDGVGLADLAPLQFLCANFPDNKFMCTMLARENQHALCIAARKFRNLFIFGCWWFLNNPSLIEEMTRMRFELLGSSMAPQHSDARVLDQVIYKWAHSRAVIAKVLAEKYIDLLKTGWTIGDDELRKDVQRLLGGSFLEFIGKGSTPIPR